MHVWIGVAKKPSRKEKLQAKFRLFRNPSQGWDLLWIWTYSPFLYACFTWLRSAWQDQLSQTILTDCSSLSNTTKLIIAWFTSTRGVYFNHALPQFVLLGWVINCELFCKVVFALRDKLFDHLFSGEVSRSRRYCNAWPTHDRAGASSWTPSPFKNQFNIEEGTWPSYQILSW